MSLRVCIILSVVVAASSKKLPALPCPDTFRYLKTSIDSRIFGEISLKAHTVNLDKQNLELELEMAMRTRHPLHVANIEIYLATDISKLLRGGASKYHVYFPTQTIIPSILSLKVNNRTICTGPTLTITPGETLAMLKKILVINRVKITEAGTAEVHPPPNPLQWNLEWIIVIIKEAFQQVHIVWTPTSIVVFPLVVSALIVVTRLVWLIIQCYGF